MRPFFSLTVFEYSLDLLFWCLLFICFYFLHLSSCGFSLFSSPFYFSSVLNPSLSLNLSLYSYSSFSSVFLPFLFHSVLISSCFHLFYPPSFLSSIIQFQSLLLFVFPSSSFPYSCSPLLPLYSPSCFLLFYPPSFLSSIILSQSLLLLVFPSSSLPYSFTSTRLSPGSPGSTG